MKKDVEIAIVKWFDSFFKQTVDHLDDLPDMCHMISIGMVVRDTVELLTLALDWLPDDDSFRYTLTIPKRNIIEDERIKRRIDY